MDNDKITMDIDERIDRFLRGKMTPEEEASFKQDLENDADLKERAVSQAFLVKSMQMTGKLPDMTLTAGGNAYPVAASKSLWKKFAYAAAAIAILVICCVPLVKYHHSTSLAEEYLSTSHVTYMVNRGGDSLTQVEVNEICLAVKSKKDLSENISRLQDIKNEIEKDPLSKYAYYEYDVTWYLSLAYLEKGKRRAAIKILEDYIQSNPNDPRSYAMSELLDKIRAI